MSLDASTESIPIVRQISHDLDVQEVFQALAEMPGRLWLDSANSESHDVSQLDHQVSDDVRQLSRYSFLTADPIHQVIAYPGDPDPWPELSELVSKLPRSDRSDLPPFQGGIAGTIGYESARWLEPMELANCHQEQEVDFHVPAMSLGVYDWVIAIDHLSGQRYLVCQGFCKGDLLGSHSTANERRQRAEARADQIEELLREFGDRSGETDAFSPALAFCDDRATEVTSDFAGQEFRDAVSFIVDEIRSGTAFQVNLAHRLIAPQSMDSGDLYVRLRASNPAPFAGYYDGGDFQVLSSSPEGFLKVRGRKVETRPIKGTVPRTGDDSEDRRLVEQLVASDKDHAENVMIVDLMRNDLSRVCDDQSVVVSRLCQVERYQFVHHLVSVVEGQLRKDADVVDLLRVCFPGGSVTGAPKIEAMKMIARLEKHPRGAYCGSMGYVSCNGDADFNILIRTITASDGQLQFPVGGGITARSLPESEEAETWAKAKGMLQAVRPLARRNSAVIAKG